MRQVSLFVAGILVAVGCETQTPTEPSVYRPPDNTETNRRTWPNPGECLEEVESVVRWIDPTGPLDGNYVQWWIDFRYTCGNDGGVLLIYLAATARDQDTGRVLVRERLHLTAVHGGTTHFAGQVSGSHGARNVEVDAAWNVCWGAQRYTTGCTYPDYP